MAERGALWLLSLLCLTFLYTETTAAKHVDKGKCPQQPPLIVVLCVCFFVPPLKKLACFVSGVGVEKRTECLRENQTEG